MGLWWRKVQCWLESVQHEAKQEQAAFAQKTKTPPLLSGKSFFIASLKIEVELIYSVSGTQQSNSVIYNI